MSLALRIPCPPTPANNMLFTSVSFILFFS
jgi:hypothetical protein